MSRPVLPSQNSRYWGHDLNNYLLSLASDIDEVNRRLNNEIVETNTVVLENVGFVTGTYNIRPADQPTNPEEGRNGSLWKYTKNDFLKSTTKLFNTNADALVLSGTVGFQLNVDNRVELIFKPIEHTIFSSNSLMIATYNNSGDIDLMSTEPLSAGFYNVFIYYDRESDSVQTVLSQQMLVNPCMILVGTLDTINYSASKDNNEYIFVPRVFSASKLLLSSIKDCLEPKTSIIGEAVSGNYLPLINVPYYMMINGIYPNKPNQSNEILNNPFESQDCKKIIAETDPEGWYDCYANNLNKLEISSSRLSTKSDILRQCQYDLYLSISGKIFSFRHNLNNLYTDYNVQSKYDLRFLDELRAGGLVYVGTYYSYTTQDSNVFSSAQTGGIPPILNATQYNWNKIVLEDKEFHSIDDDTNNNAIGVRDLYFISVASGEAVPYYVSTKLNSITTINLQYRITGGTTATALHTAFWGSFYTDSSCSTPAIAGSVADLSAKTTYYFKFTSTLRDALIGANTSPQNLGGIELRFTLERQPNKYKIKINPEKNVTDSAMTENSSYPGYGVINLNLPTSNNLMIPVFDNTQVSTTNTSLTIPQIITPEIYSESSLQLTTKELIIADEDNFIEQFWHTAGVDFVDGVYSVSSGTHTYTFNSSVYNIIKKFVNIGETKDLLYYGNYACMTIKRNSDNSLVFSANGSLSIISYSTNTNVLIPSTLYIALTTNITSWYSYKTTADPVKISIVSPATVNTKALSINSNGNVALNTNTHDISLSGKNITLTGDSNTISMTPTQTTLNQPLYTESLICSEAGKIFVKYKEGGSSMFSGIDEYGGLFIGLKYDNGKIPSANKRRDNSIGYFDSDGTIKCTSTSYTSDRRYKTNIQPISASSCLQAVRDLNVYSYSYTDINKDSLGMMAQDIEKYLPDYAHLLVHEDSTGKKHVEEHKLLFILWQAVKELLKEKD